MEYLAAPLECAIELQSAIKAGESVRTGAQRFAGTFKCEFTHRVQRLLYVVDDKESLKQATELAHTPLQRALFLLIVRGCHGEPVGSAIEALISEMRQTSETQIEEHIQALPLKMMLPILLLQFPAFLILLLGPMFLEFVGRMK
jgi:hypothetical protein